MSTVESNRTYEKKVAAIHCLRVNVKSLVAESRIIRRETERAGEVYRNMLALHRLGRLREEARAAHLALAFLRGRTYASVEGPGSKKPDQKRIVDKLRRYLEGNVDRDVFEWIGRDAMGTATGFQSG